MMMLTKNWSDKERVIQAPSGSLHSPEITLVARGWLTFVVMFMVEIVEKNMTFLPFSNKFEIFLIFNILHFSSSPPPPPSPSSPLSSSFFFLIFFFFFFFSSPFPSPSSPPSSPSSPPSSTSPSPPSSSPPPPP